MAVRVMIVDDQAPFRMAARLVVESTDGFDVIGEAESGEDSIDLAKEVDPDLVLMDVNLPGINGLEATRSILDGADHRVVILLLSTYEESEFGPRIAESGAAGFISKSAFEPDGLREAWERATSAV
jgi:DNA-binding NarL/FixJ family response regulator